MAKSPNRESGIILHPTSLPGSGGIGTLGQPAFDFVDFLSASEQQVWQVLPLGPTGMGNSPYMSPSAFAGNPLLLDLTILQDAGWLQEDPLEDAATANGFVDFESVIPHKRRWLRRAFEGFQERGSDADRAAFTRFRQEQAVWLEDFALFTALGEHHEDQQWIEWPDPLRDRKPDALVQAQHEHSDVIERVCFEQWCFETQWQALRQHANRCGIAIIGDIPIFVAHNSADVWANREIFYLNEQGKQEVVAGVPPDYFSETGQLWGNPLYRWDVLKARNYDWWIERFRGTFRLVDRVRVDHFRGFESYWEVPAGAPNAIEGKWVAGPGRDFFDRVEAVFGEVPVIAEDLGIITPAVEDLRDAVGLPGMKVLHFAWGGGSDHAYLPHNYPRNCVVYTGTHDNDTTVGWYRQLEPALADQVRRYFNIDGRDIAWQLLTAAWSSVAELAVCPAQDLLSLPSEHRMNTPGEAEGNWAWRLRAGQLDDHVLTRLRALTRRYGRSTASHQI